MFYLLRWTHLSLQEDFAIPEATPETATRATSLQQQVCIDQTIARLGDLPLTYSGGPPRPRTPRARLSCKARRAFCSRGNDNPEIKEYTVIFKDHHDHALEGTRQD